MGLAKDLGASTVASTVASWNVFLTAAERQAILDGTLPILIRPNALTYYDVTNDSDVPNTFTDGLEGTVFHHE